MKLFKAFLKRLFRVKKHEHEPDKPLIFSTLILVVFGLLMLASASAVSAYSRFGDSYYYLKHQLIPLIIGLGLFFLFSRIDYHFWRRNAIYFLGGTLVLLILVFIPGLSAGYGTARSWIHIFGFSIQPSEFVKLFFLIYLAAWLELRGKAVKEFSQGLAPFLIILGVISLLMYKQPDLGTLSIIILSSLIVYFVGGAKIRHMLAILILMGMALWGVVGMNGYQAQRFQCLTDPGFSPNDICYQINQSLIAVGSGGWTGRGLGESRQKFLYLPEVSGDAIFPIISEEIGFIFSTLLIFLYLFIFYRGWIIAKSSADVFGRLLSIGVVSWILIQVFLNIGGMTGLVPMTGVPLPFISSGGSAIMAGLMALGILVNISKQTSNR